MICNNCGASNREGELICQSCGRLLVSDAAATRQIKVTSGLLVQNTQQRATDKLQTVHLDIDAESFDYPVQSGHEILVGRGLEAGASQLSLDVSDLGGAEKGVSRRHALIRIEGYSAYIIDLSSTNGTFLNGRRLHPDHRHLLYSNDVVRFGALEVRIRLA
ncbi:MAG: FHA domain-containing protein [Anaerolineae bacterium]|nr:FHA domain-containing protein [Anaerolineae bacterium]